jgi:hypothetical protein
MRRFVSLALILSASVLVIGCYVQVSGPDLSGNSSAIRMSGAGLNIRILQTAPVVSGLWEFSGSMKSGDQAIFVMVRGLKGDFNLGMPFAAERFAPAGNKKSFHNGQWNSTNEVGAVLFHLPESSKSPGKFEFLPDRNYAQRALALLREPVTPEELFYFWMRDISVSDLEAYGQCGVPLNAKELLRLRSAGASPDYVIAIRSAGDYSPTDIATMRNHGVTANYPAELVRARLKLTAQEILRLWNYGVTTDEASRWNKSGIPLNADAVARLHSFGIQPEYGAAVHQLFEKAGMDELIKLRNFGVPESYLRQMKEVQAAFSVDNIARLWSHGVPVEYVKTWRNSGYEFDEETLIRLRNYGVPADFAAPLKEMKLQAEDLIKLRNYGVTPDYCLAWRKAGYDISVQDLVRLRVAGVPESYATALMIPGRSPLSVDTILKLRMRGLSAEEIRAVRE